MSLAPPHRDRILLAFALILISIFGRVADARRVAALARDPDGHAVELAQP
jgi:hypothetical protein